MLTILMLSISELFAAHSSIKDKKQGSKEINNMCCYSTAYITNLISAVKANKQPGVNILGSEASETECTEALYNLREAVDEALDVSSEEVEQEVEQEEGRSGPSKACADALRQVREALGNRKSHSDMKCYTKANLQDLKIVLQTGCREGKYTKKPWPKATQKFDYSEQ